LFLGDRPKGLHFRIVSSHRPPTSATDGVSRACQRRKGTRPAADVAEKSFPDVTQFTAGLPRAV
jgi:hypothetical protein